MSMDDEKLITGSCIPRPPKKGEKMRCQQCGKVMLPKDFSTNPLIRKREFKWQMHNACMISISEQCDLKTRGLVQERKQAQEKLSNYNQNELQY